MENLFSVNLHYSTQGLLMCIYNRQNNGRLGVSSREPYRVHRLLRRLRSREGRDWGVSEDTSGLGRVGTGVCQRTPPVSTQYLTSDGYPRSRVRPHRQTGNNQTPLPRSRFLGPQILEWLIYTRGRRSRRGPSTNLYVGEPGTGPGRLGLDVSGVGALNVRGIRVLRDQT